MGNCQVTENNRRKLAYAYITAKQTIIQEGYASEIDWQESISFDNITEADLIREMAWVILSCGMRETVIRNIFPDITLVFFYWRSAREIYENQKYCRKKALSYFNNPRKINAIIEIAQHVNFVSFQRIKESIRNEGISYIKQFPYMGPATSYHFAKNIGLPVAKPDRHLVKIAKKNGYNSVQKLCSDIANVIGDKISVVDLVLWRYATIHANYLDFFSLS